MYKLIIRPFLFLFDPESVHKFAAGFIRFFLGPKWLREVVHSYFSVRSSKLDVDVCGLHFPNPIGIAAGFDKDAMMVEQLSALGFGFIEIGTLTPKPQPGNQKPRLFRLPEDNALINRMGFNNNGVDQAVERLKELKKRNSEIIVGGNIGKNKDTPNDIADRDYEYCLEALYDVVDYFVVNVSSPNTPDLRNLQEKEPLTRLLSSLKDRLSEKSENRPLLLKIAPDLGSEQIDDIVEIVKKTEIDGVIVSNTTIDRSGLNTSKNIVDGIGPGGLSGKPLRKRSTEMIRYLREHLGEKIAIIGVGGIFTVEDVKEKLDAGANLVQIYTGFIYEGPSMVKRINNGLLKG